MAPIILPNRAPSLGHLLQPLKHLGRHILSCQSDLIELDQKLGEIDQLSSIELLPFVEGERAHLEKMGVSEKRLLASAKMKTLSRGKEKELQLALDAIEAATYVLLKHVEHFVLSSSPNQVMTPFQVAHRNISGMRISLIN